MQIAELSTDEEWRSAAAVLKVLRPALDGETFVARREQLSTEGYHLLGVRVGDKTVSVASYTISPHVMLGRELLIHDMATVPEERGAGYASALLEKLEVIGRQLGCGRVFVHTRNAQSLYARNGFQDYSTGMIKRLD